MARSEEPDPRVVWRLLGESLRPWAGWLLTLAGAGAMILGYLGVSREVLVAKQLPFLVSGGLTGIALVFVGGVLLGTQDVRRQAERIDEFEQKLDDLHRVLLSRESGGVSSNGQQAVGEQARDTAAELTVAADQVVAVPGGSSYHRPDCAVVADRDGLETMTAAEAGERALSPCRRCQPATVGATAG